MQNEHKGKPMTRAMNHPIFNKPTNKINLIDITAFFGCMLVLLMIGGYNEFFEGVTRIMLVVISTVGLLSGLFAILTEDRRKKK